MRRYAPYWLAALFVFLAGPSILRAQQKCPPPDSNLDSSGPFLCVDASPAPAVFGQPITITVTTTPVLIGKVQLFIDPTPNGPPAAVAQLDGSGSTCFPPPPSDASVPTCSSFSNLSVGVHHISVSFSGGGPTPVMIPADLALQVNQAQTSLSTPTFAGAPVVGQTLTFSTNLSVAAPGAGTPTGTITFFDGDAMLGSTTVTNGAGTYSISTSFLTPGTHIVSASYSGDPNFAPSSSSLTLPIGKIPTTTTVSPSLPAAVFGQLVTYSATVTPPGASGTVTFSDNGVSVSTSLTSGHAQTPPTALAVGSHSIAAAYSGDNIYAASASGAVTLQVNPANTALSPVTFTGTPSPGQTLTFTTTLSVVAPGAGAPTRTITFADFDSETVIGTATVDGVGTYTVTTNSLATGTHRIIASYSGDDNFGPSTSSPPLSLTIGKTSTTTTVSTSLTSAVFGQPVIYTATVAPATATGTVTFADNGTPVTGAAVTLANGQAQFTPSAPLAVGSHSITAAYSGDNAFNTSTSSAVAVTVAKASTTISLASSNNGNTLSLTATVAPQAPGAGTPTGSVQFLRSGTVIGTVTLTGSSATLSVSSTFGSFTAVYSGDASFNGSTSPASTTSQPQVNLTLSSSTNPSAAGQAVTFVAVVAVISGAGTPTGAVQFFDGGTSLGTAAVSGGQAVLTVPSLTVGQHAISAQYGGDALFAAASPASLTQVVGRVVTTLNVTASPTSPNSIQSVTVTAQLGPQVPSGVAAPTGQITLSDGGASLGTVSAASLGGSVSLPSLTAGPHQIQASYPGDQNWLPANASLTVTVTQAKITILTTSLPNATVAAPYSATIAAQGGAQPYQWTISGLPGGLTSSAGSISGSPTIDGTFPIAIQVADRNGVTASTTLSLTVTVLPLTITTTGLPDGRAGADYSQSLFATGGVPPYQWSSSGSSVLSVSSGGVLTGTALPGGTQSVTVQVRDTKGTTASQTLSVNVTGTALSISTPALPGGTTGSPYAALTLTAVGGTPPYTWSGTLPANLSISSDGTISGTPLVFGNTSVVVSVTDSLGANTSRTYTVNFGLPAFPGLAFAGGLNTGPQSQPPVQFALNGPFPVDLTGKLTLTFQAITGGDDPAVQFSSGGRTAQFSVPANTQAPIFGGAGLAVQTGTTAGVITLTLQVLAPGGMDVTPSPAPTMQIPIDPSVASLTSVSASRTSSGFTVVAGGFSTTREVSQAIFHFNAASGATLQTSDVTIPVASLFSGWYQSSAAAPFGGQFLYTQNFTVQGDTQSIASVTVMLVNGQGNSQMVTATLQ